MAFSIDIPQLRARSLEDRGRDVDSRLDPAQVLATTDIVEVIGEVVALSPRGRNDKREMIGLCPFHSDSTPSFEVNGSKGVYACWSCSAGLNGSRGGDAITFVRRYYGMSFKEALGYLAERQGQTSTQKKSALAYKNVNARRASGTHKPPDQDCGVPIDKAPLYEVMQQAVQFFSEEFSRSSQARQYLFDERGVNAEVSDQYIIGYVPDGFRNLEKHFKNYQTNKNLVDAGLVRESPSGKKYDFFRNRLMFGIRDENGQVIAFGGRRLSDKPIVDSNGKPIRIAKYLNSPDTAIFSKKDMLFGLYEARQAIANAGYALIVEGYMDVLSLAGYGVNNALACMGTALTPEHMQKITRHTKNLVFCLDGDEAGHQGAFRGLNAILPELKDDITVSFVSLPDKMDPDGYIRKFGKDSFITQISNSKTLGQFWKEIMLQNHDVASREGRDSLTRASQHLLKRLPESSAHRTLLEHITKTLVMPIRTNAKPTFNFGVNKAREPRASARMVMDNRHHFNASRLNTPSERLFIAVMKMPDAGRQIRDVIHKIPVDKNLQKSALIWQKQLDQSLKAGYSLGATMLLPHQRQHYQSILNAAPNIFIQYLDDVRKKQLIQEHTQGVIDKTQYLEQLQRNCLDKPC